MTAIVRRTHSSSFKTLHASLRLALLGSSALVGSATLAGQASAQSLPVPTNAAEPGVTFSGPGGGAPNNRMDVDLGGASRIIDFNSYNIGTGNTAHYSTSVAATDLVAVNRVITSGGGPSMINGTLQADAGISVWLINQEGISYNGNTTLNGGSLVLSTLDFADAGAVPGDVPLRFAGSSTSGITIGGNLNVAGSIVAIGQQITTNSALTAGNGSVVLVAASDVTFTNGLGNPLSFTVNAGTTLASASASPVNVNGNLTGNSVVVAGGMQNSLTAALLNISPTATLTATAVNGTVTLATTSTGAGIDITNGAGVTPGIALGGNLVTTGAGGDVVVASGGDLTGNGTITALNDASVSAVGDIVATTGSYTATGGALTVAAGGDATLGALAAGTDIAVSTDGSATLGGTVSAGGMLNLISLVDATINGNVTTDGDVSLVVRRDTTIGGDIDAGGAYSLETGRDLGQSGDVSAAGDVLVDVGGDANVSGLHASNGGLTSIGVTGDATLGALTAATDVSVTTGGFATVNGAVNAGNDFLVLSGTDTTLAGTVTARDVSLSSGRDTFVTGSVNAARDFLVTDTRNYTQSGTVVAGRNVDLTIDAVALATGSVSATTGFVDITADSATFAAITAGTDITADITNGADFTGALSAGGDVELTAGTDLFVRSGVSAGRAYRTTANAVTLGTTGAAATQTAGDGVLIHALGGNIVGLGSLVLSSDASAVGIPALTNLELRADAGEVRFGIDTGLVAGMAGSRTDVIVTSAPNIALGDVTANRLFTAGDTGLLTSGSIVTDDLAIDSAITLTSTTAGVTTGTLTTGGAIAISAAGDITINAGAAPTNPSAQAGTTINLLSTGGSVRADGVLATTAGDIIVNALLDVSLDGASANGLPSASAVVVRAGRDILRARALTSASDDIFIRADGNAALGTVTAADDIDITVGGALSWTALQLTGGADTARFANLSGAAGTTGGVDFLAPGTDAQLASGHVVRIRAGSVGTAAGAPVGLIAQNVTSGDFSATAQTGDIRIGQVTSSGDVSVIADQGSITGLPALAPITGGSIGGTGSGAVDTVLLDITGSGAIGAISAGTVRTVTDATTLRIGSITANTVDLGAVQTLHVGTVVASGAVDLATTGGTALSPNVEFIGFGTQLAPGFGNASLTSTRIDGTVDVSALRGIAQLGTLRAGTGTGIGGVDQIVVSARALTITQADALDGSLVVTASDGLLSLTTGSAAQHLTLVKRNDDGTSIGSDTLTDILAVGNSFSSGGSVTAGFGVDIRSETSLVVNSVTALGNSPTDRNILVTAAKDMLLTTATATRGSIGLYGGSWIRGDIGFGVNIIPGMLRAAEDVTVRAAGDVQYWNMTAGDDVDVLSTGGNLLTKYITGTGTGLGGTSVQFTGLPGQSGTLAVVSGEDAALADATIRLRAATGNITFSSWGLIEALGRGDVLLNAAGNVSLTDVTAANGSIGVRARNATFWNLVASEDVAVRTDLSTSIETIVAGDDVDIFANSISLTKLLLSTTSTGLGNGGTSVLMPTVAGSDGSFLVQAGEDAQLADSTIRLRSLTTVNTVGEVRTLGTGNVLVNAGTDVNLGTITAADGSIGILAGGEVFATQLTASRDIGIRGGTTGATSLTNVNVLAATAGDDIDILALNGNILLVNGTASGTPGTGGSSISYIGDPGTADAVETGPEDGQLVGSTIRLRSAVAAVSSTSLSALGMGDVLVNASTDATLGTVNAVGGSIGILAGAQITANRLTASRDIGIRGGSTGATTRTNVTIGSATAGDDIDITALNGDIRLTDATSTGLGAGGTSVILGGPGGLDTVAIGAEDAQLTGATIRLRAAAGSISSLATEAGETATLRTEGTGDILVNASGDVALDTLDAAGGSIGVLAGGRMTAIRLTATRDIGVLGGTSGAAPSTDVAIGTAIAGDDIDIVALNGTLDMTDGTATGVVGAGGTSVTFASVPAGAYGAVGIVATEDAQLGALSTIRLRAEAGDVISAGSLQTQARGEVFVNAARGVTLSAVNAADGSIGVLAGGQVTARRLTASRDIGVRGGTTGATTPTDVSIIDAIAGDDIDVLAFNGNLSITNATALGTSGTGGSSIRYVAAAGSLNAVETGAEDAQLGGSTIRLRAETGGISSTGTLIALGRGEILVNALTDVALATANAADGSLGILAGGPITGATLSASRDIVVQGGTLGATARTDVTIGSASAGDDIDIVALNGNLTVTNATATSFGPGGSSVGFGTAGALDTVSVITDPENTQLTGSTIRLRSQTGSVTSTGTLLAQGTGDVLVNAQGDASLATTTASRGSVALLAGGNLTAATTTASEDVAARAGNNASLTSTTAGDDIEVAAGGRVTLGTATIGGTPTGLDARHATLSSVQAGLDAGIAFTAGDPRGPAGLPTGSALATDKNGRNITIAAADIDLQGVLDATTGTITLRNTGANATLIGDGTVTTGANFGLSNTELSRLRSNTLVIDSGSRALELGTFTVGADTGKTDTRFLATGTVEITGAVTMAGTAERTLQIGGLLGELGNDAAAVPLATSLVARIDRASTPSIVAGAANVELRAEKILFGTGAMVDEYIGKNDDEIARIVSDPTSKLYYDAAAQPLDVFLTAKTVTVGYKNFALFQNTDINRSAGVLINSPAAGLPQQTALALRLVSTGEGGNNSFAMFGVVNNFFGTSAALLTNDAIQIVNPSGDLNDFRITRASSRINGCVIGAPDRGCLATDIPQPNFNLYDERKIALFDVDDDQTIAVSPLIGRGNDGLIVNVADAPVGIDTIECRPEDPNCPAKEGN
ncbi:filamentous hemagglutinin N-terminal domain-containing protein [Novosphingobium kaempferiae]|uniref:filamentous hemagglutinin N-terminal domain-containing protein n=1 Tax=Novosphingobium kaempferiae TaxID=2896849 RepID=UPI001E3472E3|nr:filamentous hemagglutinin N-terminal domain-containing protein [Novosphingobium kaempferiae]